MPDLRNPVELDVLESGLAELRRVLEGSLTGSGDNLFEAYARLAQSLADQVDVAAGPLAEALLAAELAGRAGVASRLPPGPPPGHQESALPLPAGQLEQIAAGMLGLSPEMQELYLSALPPAVAAGVRQHMGGGPSTTDLLASGQELGVQLPVIEAAVETLRKRQLLSWSDYKRLDAEARRKAVAVAGEVTREAAGTLQQLLESALREGTSGREFAREAKARLGGVLTGAQLETTFRDAVQLGYAAGQEAVLADPLVGGAFPFVENLSIPDSRRSPVCRAVSVSGIGGTAVYRRDDPTWQRLRPPRHPRCRCTASYLTLEMAARKGIREAIGWLETGRPPARPEWVAMPAAALEEGL